MDLKLEQLSVHSRDISCRYVVVRAGETLSYSIKPQRNSVFYGLYKQSQGTKPNLSQPRNLSKGGASLQASSNFEERIRQAHLEVVSERRRLVGGKVFNGSLAVEQEGMYCLVFDNTFSKQKSKLVTFILQVHSSNNEAPSKAVNLIDDEEAIPQVVEEHLSGILLKRRRKKLQGWARRWFVLDFETNTLNYYLNEASSVLRGAIPLSVAVFSANTDTFEINIDSGAEIWNLRARSEGSFALWKNSLAQARESDLAHEAKGRQKLSSQESTSAQQVGAIGVPSSGQAERILAKRLTVLLSEFTSVHENFREAILAEGGPMSDASDDKRSHASTTHSKSADLLRLESSNSSSPKKNFWSKRRPSELSAMVPSTEEMFVNARASTARRSSLFNIESQMSHALQNFRNIMREHTLISTSPVKKSRAADVESDTSNRLSIDSTRSKDEIWSDALSGPEDFGFLVAHQDDVLERIDLVDVDDSSDEESLADLYSNRFATPVSMPGSSNFSTDLQPLKDLASMRIERRITIPRIVDQPPSALKLMASKVGSDVSSLSAPAATNEPLSLLQRVAEDLEYSELLDNACVKSSNDGNRILTVAAFAVSAFSSSRHRERAKRKPFNPMLGETFELVREDKQYRFIAEKVQHRPLVGVAAYAESPNWNILQYQETTQKFYGKSMLLSTEGTTTVSLNTDEKDVYVWEKPELYLKNITWGEKFLEPYGEMIVRNIVSGETAIVKFLPSKSGWGSSRSEEIIIEAFDAQNKKYNKDATGSWTRSLSIDSQEIWKVSNLVNEPESHCGFTGFAAQLNEITAIEKDRLPPTDSRLRPDLRFREEGNLKDAERYKIQVEERQRRRRAELEEAGLSHQPQFFKSTDDGKRWIIKDGEEGYWRSREKRFEGLNICELFS